ncbi:MAG: phosphatidate cytidylyltransferase, partial [Anaerolineales bacterium]|nr:phosphatidate cytidylyltransferase [Anaerolineales bacterium]
MNSILATILTFAISLIWLRLMDFVAHRGWIESRLSRKLIHIGTGPVYVICWLLFKDVPEARWLAALVPFLITIQFALVGLGLIKDEASVQALSRSGDRREILRGPLFYGIAFVVLTLVYWKETPIGITALMIMCGGDGVADVIGRRIISVPIQWNKEKTLAGSLSVLVGGSLLALIVLGIYIWAGVFSTPLSAYLVPVTAISLAAMLVES